MTSKRSSTTSECSCADMDPVEHEKAVVRRLAELCDHVGAHFGATKIRQFSVLLRACADHIDERVPVDEKDDGFDEWGAWWNRCGGEA